MKSFVAARRATAWLLGLLAVTVTVASAAYLVAGVLGYERYVITGGSMSGTFEKGSVAFEEQVPVADLVVGDVITYLPPAESGVNTLVTHRITSITPGPEGVRVLRTRGDANADEDPWEFVLLAETQPVVSFTVPHVGHLFIALADSRTRMLVIGVPAATIALLALRDLVVALLPQRSRRRAATTSRPGAGLGAAPGPA